MKHCSHWSLYSLCLSGNILFILYACFTSTARQSPVVFGSWYAVEPRFFLSTEVLSWSVSPSHPAGLKNKYFWIFMFWFALFSTPKLINPHTQPHYFSCKICFPKEFSPFFLISSFSAESELLILAVLTGGHRSQTCLQHSSASLPSS